MYWSDWGTTPPNIKKASMDGENVKIIIDTNIIRPNSLAIEFKENRLYWIDASTDKLVESS